MNKTLTQAIKDRRSVYALGKKEVVSRQRITELVEFTLTHTPSAFNSQSARILLLFGKESSQFWSLVTAALESLVPPSDFPKTKEKIQGFDSGYGTILFFEDQSVVEGLQKSFPLYADNFPIWSLQSNGMLEYGLWIALQAEGLGSSLQHYNPLVDEAVRSTWQLPESWKLLAQMPFGSPEGLPGDKEFSPLEYRLRVAQ